eukprot:675204-Hanusia_phi.AAC.11
MHKPPLGHGANQVSTLVASDGSTARLPAVIGLTHFCHRPQAYRTLPHDTMLVTHSMIGPSKRQLRRVSGRVTHRGPGPPPLAGQSSRRAGPDRTVVPA